MGLFHRSPGPRLPKFNELSGPVTGNRAPGISSKIKFRVLFFFGGGRVGRVPPRYGIGSPSESEQN
jgi:hypothetical protein